jgi:hypothetical protein
MNRLSASGPDGFGPAFYQATWQTAKPSVMDFLDAFYCSSTDLTRINTMALTWFCCKKKEKKKERRNSSRCFPTNMPAKLQHKDHGEGADEKVVQQ